MILFFIIARKMKIILEAFEIFVKRFGTVCRKTIFRQTGRGKNAAMAPMPTPWLKKKLESFVSFVSLHFALGWIFHSLAPRCLPGRRFAEKSTEVIVSRRQSLKQGVAGFRQRRDLETFVIRRFRCRNRSCRRSRNRNGFRRCKDLCSRASGDGKTPARSRPGSFPDRGSRCRPCHSRGGGKHRRFPFCRRSRRR